MDALWKWLFRQSALGKFLDGKKSWIAAGFLILAQVSALLSGLGDIFPDAEWIKEAVNGLAKFDQVVKPWLETVGLSGLLLGLADKNVKDRELKAGK